MDNPTSLTEAQLNVLGVELRDGSSNPSSQVSYSADDATACDELNAVVWPYEIEVEMDSVSQEAAVLANRDPMGLTQYLMKEKKLRPLDKLAADDQADENHSDAAYNVSIWLRDPADRSVLASNETAQAQITALGPGAGNAGLFEQKHLDWFNEWGWRMRSKMQALRTPDGIPLPYPCEVIWVTEARKRVS